MCVVCVVGGGCVCECSAHRTGEGTGSPEAGITGSCKPLTWVQETKLWPSGSTARITRVISLAA